MAIFVFLLSATDLQQPDSAFAATAQTVFVADRPEPLKSISDDGNIIAFISQIDYPSLGDSNGLRDAYVFNRSNGTLALLSKTISGTTSPNIWLVEGPWVTGNGRYVFFVAAGNAQLTADDTDDGATDVFLYDRNTSALSLVSTDDPVLNGADVPSVSDDGRYVVYGNNYGNSNQIILLDRQTGVRQNIYENISGGMPNATVGWPIIISGDGNTVAYYSTASDLVQNDTNNALDVFVYNRLTDQTERVSVKNDGSQSTGVILDPNWGSGYIGLSDNGNRVAFVSGTNDLVQGDNNGKVDIFVRDRAAGFTIRASLSGTGQELNGNSSWPALSDDGNTISFQSEATNAVSGDTNNAMDIFVKNIASNYIEPASVSSSGVGGDRRSMREVFSGDGKHLAFDSDARNFVTGHTYALYARDLGDIIAAKPVAVLVHGWLGGPSSTFQSQCSMGVIEYPVAQADEMTNNWTELADALRTDGFRVYIVHLTSGKNQTLSLEDNAKNQGCLKDQLQQVVNANPGVKLNVVAHSMGGLVARACIEKNIQTNQTLCGDWVKTLITLGTPHQGVPYDLSVWAYYGRLGTSANCNNQKAVCEMQDEQLPYDFNERYFQPTPSVDYHLVAGDLSASETLGMGLMFSRLANGADDGFVQVASALGRGNVTKLFKTPEAHTRDLGFHSYLGPKIGNQPPASYSQCIRFVMLGNSNACSGASVSSPSTSATSGATFVPVGQGTLSAGGSLNETIGVDQSGAAVFGVTWENGSLSFDLVSPTGQIIDTTYAANNPTEVVYDTRDNGAYYQVNNAEAGLWTLHLSGATQQTQYSAAVVFTSAISLKVQTDKNVYAPNETAAIIAQVTEPTHSSSIVAVLTYDDGSTTSVNLSWNGSAYVGNFVMPNKIGHGVVKSSISGTDALGNQYIRQTDAVFEVSSGSGQSRSIYLPLILK